MHLSVRSMCQDDLAEVVRVHQISFRGFFLDKLGPAFLRAYYRAVLDFPDSVANVAVDENGVIRGFVVGFMNPSGFYRHLRKRRLRFLPAVVLALVRRPRLLLGVLRNGARVSRRSVADDTSRCGELSSIAAATPGVGIGSMLLLSFVNALRRRGCRRISLTTDKTDNDRAREFYRRHGFVEVEEEQRGTRTLIVYALDLCDVSPDFRQGTTP